MVKANSKLMNDDWWNDDTNGDPYGFSVIPVGTRNVNAGWGQFDSNADFWSASEKTSTEANIRFLDWNGKYLKEDYSKKGNGYSLRCNKD